MKKSIYVILMSFVFAGAAATLQAVALAQSDNTASILGHCAGCNFGRVDWHGRNLRGVHASGINLDRANLRGADLRDAHFAGVNFEGADLRDADLRGSHLSGCNLQGAKLRGARLEGASLNGSNLEGVDLISANLRAVHMVSSNARDAKLNDADLDGAVLCGEETEINEDGNGSRTIIHGKTICTELAGAVLQGARMHHIQRCVWDSGSIATCTEVSAQTLRDVAHANLTGVQL